MSHQRTPIRTASETSKTKRKKQRRHRFSGIGQWWLRSRGGKLGTIILGALLIAVALGAQAWTKPAYASTLDWKPPTEAAPTESALVFAARTFTPPGQDLSAATILAKRDAADVDALASGLDIERTAINPVAAADTVPAGCEVIALQSAPRGPWIAVELACNNGHIGLVRVVHSATGEARWTGTGPGASNVFLGWSPTGNEIIVRANEVSDSGVYLIHIGSGKATPLNVPSTTYTLAISDDGKGIVYALTQGLGFGSEIWVADLDGSNARRLTDDPTHIIAYPRFSPDGAKIIYIRMADSNIPFTVGELWVMNQDGSSQTLLADADAGHGYAPSWSPDGLRVAFVHRENGSDIVADQVSDRLTSNVHLAEINSGAVEAVTTFADTLVEAPVWSPDGGTLALAAKPRDGISDIWLVSVATREKQAHQATQNANARYPTWTSGK